MKVTIKRQYILCRGGEETVLPYDYVSNFKNGFACVGLDCRYGFIDETGKEVVPLKYDYATEFEENGLAIVRCNGEIFFVDETGKERVPSKEELCEIYYDDIVTEV